jgi:GAF domain-containing protein
VHWSESQRLFGESATWRGPTNLAINGHPIVEALLVPFREGGKPIGTLWVATHEPKRPFDLEDERILTNLAGITSAAHQVTRSLKRLGAADDGLPCQHDRRVVDPRATRSISA